MMIRAANRQRNASACVECAVCLLFLVPLLIGLWEVGRLVEVEQFLNNAVREGGRQASTGMKNVFQPSADSATTRSVSCSPMPPTQSGSRLWSGFGSQSASVSW